MKLTTVLLAALAAFFMSTAHAEVTEMYMANSAGGYLVLTDNPCTIEGIKERFPHAAYETDDIENRIDGCWDRPEAPKPFEPFVNVYMVEFGSVNIGIFKQKLFSPIKQRQPEVKEEKLQPKATL